MCISASTHNDQTSATRSFACHVPAGSRKVLQLKVLVREVPIFCCVIRVLTEPRAHMKTLLRKKQAAARPLNIMLTACPYLWYY